MAVPFQEPQKRTDSNLNLSQEGLSGIGRRELLIDRFRQLASAEQALVLAEALVVPGESTTAFHMRIKEAVHLFRDTDVEARVESFTRLLNGHPELEQSTLKTLIEKHAEYFPALITALNAIYRGEEVGLLTARGNRRGHTVLIDAVQAFLGHEIPRKNMYFVNDETRNSRLPKSNTADRKLQVLRDFLAGEYADENGNIHQLSRRFEQVYFYDDEQKNIDLVQHFADGNCLEQRLFSIDATKITIEEEWQKLLQAVEQGAEAPENSKDIIHFFDIDGTLIDIPARMYVKHIPTGETVITITQEEFAEHPDVNYWIEQGVARRPDLSREQLEYDFMDFRDEDRIERMILDGWEQNQMFKPGSGKPNDFEEQDNG